MNQGQNGEKGPGARYKKFRVIGVLAFLGAILIGLIVTFLQSKIPAMDNATVDEVFGIMMLVVGGAGIALFFVGRAEMRKYCEKCDQSLAGCAYEYISVSSKKAFLSNDYDQTVTVKVEFRATCPYCGTQKVFRKSFNVKPSDNLEYIVDAYAKEVFKH